MDINPFLILYQIGNFLILLAVLGWLFNKFIRPFMHKRNEEIAEAFRQIEASREELRKAQSEIQSAQQEMKQKARDEVAKAVAEGDRLRNEIIEQAKKDASVVLEKSRQEIAQEKEKALLSIKDEISDLAISISRRILQSHLHEKENQALVHAIIADIENNRQQWVA